MQQSRPTPAWLSGVTLPSWRTDALNYCYENCGVSYYCKEEASWRTYNECRETTKERLIREGAQQEGKVGLVAKYLLAGYVGGDEAVSLYREAAEGGYDLAQYTLGQMLYDSNLPEAVSWLEKAAVQGNPDAGEYLVVAYLTDSTVGRDEAKAIDYYRKSTGSDLGKAEYYIGYLYEFGWEGYLSASKEKSLQWYQRAAGRNYTPALLTLSKIFYTGNSDVEKDTSLAYNFASRASRLGHNEATFFLATMLIDKTNPRKNVEEAIILLKELVEDIDLSSHIYNDTPFILGEIYNSKYYGVYDPELALWYYRIAKSRGNSKAEEKIRLLEHKA
jgi:TPR repeat protein